MEKEIVGFAGEMGAGKGTAVDLLKLWFPGTESSRFSDSLREFYIRCRSIHLTKKDRAAWIFLRDTLTEALEASFGPDVVTGAPAGAFTHFARWLLKEFIPRHKGKWPKNGSTPDLQDISTKVREFFGEDTLKKAIKTEVDRSTSESPFVVLEGIRRLVDIRGWHIILIYIDAVGKLRHKWHKARREKPGDAQLTFKQFLELGKAEAEREIPLLKQHAYVVIKNNGTKKQFLAKLDREFVKLSTRRSRREAAK